MNQKNSNISKLNPEELYRLNKLTKPKSTYKELSERFGVSESTIKVRIHEYKKRIPPETLLENIKESIISGLEDESFKNLIIQNVDDRFISDYQHLYIWLSSDNRIKIGKSNEVEKRLVSVENQYREDNESFRILNIATLFHCGDMEKDLIELFRKHTELATRAYSPTKKSSELRYTREWLHYNKELLPLIEQIVNLSREFLNNPMILRDRMQELIST